MLAALAELDATPTGHALLQSIEASGRTVTIRAPAPGDGNSCGYDDPAARFTQPDGTPGAGTNSTVEFNPDRDVIGPAAWETRPPAIGLGHELIHADQAAHGTTTPGTTNNDARPDPANPGAIQQTNTREVETTGVPPNDTRDFTENDLRREWDPPQPQRPWY
ncbi:MAG: hypothetical protein IPP07_28320 [Holophagales bacterium]|nr:hypothetical protein [Holophagales bacterium]